MLRPIAMLTFAVVSAGCMQIAGVSDFKVEEACTAPPGSPCRVSPNCGCAATETCELTTAAGAGACVPAGAAPAGASCTLNGDCAKGLACLNNTCAAYCVKDDDCTSKSCGPITLGGAAVVGVGLCNTVCDPLNASACPSGQACRFTTNKKTSCFPNPGSGGIGASCATDEECGPSFFCDGTACTELCTEGGSCASGGSCGEAVTEGNGVRYGACSRD